MVQALDNALVDDDPSSQEEDASAHEALEEYNRGESFSADEIKRELTDGAFRGRRRARLATERRQSATGARFLTTSAAARPPRAGRSSGR
jgi:hypothetical protein